MDLALLDKAVAMRSARWEAAGISWEIVGSGTEAVPKVSLRAESPARVAELLLAVSGEADLTYAELEPRITDPIVDRYQITSRAGLDRCLDDFERHMGIDATPELPIAVTTGAAEMRSGRVQRERDQRP